jgi:precorrin-6Y C5,15-methyltransferase (decarboxylating)
MAKTDDTPAPWLSIIGLTEAGLEALSTEARAALEAAEVIYGGRRHLDLVGAGTRGRDWAVPFADTVPLILAEAGRSVAVLASNDPFWHGAGSVLARHLPPTAWRAYSAPSTAAMAAARLGWAGETATALALHATPLSTVRRHLRPGGRLIVMVRDGAAVTDLAALLTGFGFGPSILHVLESLGGPRERVRSALAASYDLTDVAHPVCVAIEAVADDDALVIGTVSGLADAAFAHDGQLTKREVRALTLSTLAPRGGELLWDIGAGSGSIGIEWLLCDPLNRAIAVETNPERAARARANAMALGVPHLDVRDGRAPDALAGLPIPDAIFIGGGANEPGVLDAAFTALRPGGRLVVNAVTLETERVVTEAERRLGGTLTRISIERAVPVGGLTGWRAAMPVVQWCVTKRATRDILGIGFRAGASAAQLTDAIRSALADGPVSALATPADKVDSPAFIAAARAVGLPVYAIAPDALVAADPRCLTRSLKVAEKRGVGSVAEAAALAAAGPDAQLTAARVIAADGHVTTARARAPAPDPRVAAPAREAP